MEKIDNLEQQLMILKRNQQEMKDEIAFLEAEVLALGNILIRSNIVKLTDLSIMTDAVLRQKMIEKQKEREASPFHMTKEELEKAAQN